MTPARPQSQISAAWRVVGVAFDVVAPSSQNRAEYYNARLGCKRSGTQHTARRYGLRAPLEKDAGISELRSFSANPS